MWLALGLVGRLVAGCAVAWSAAALWIDGPRPEMLAGSLAILCLIVGWGALWRLHPASLAIGGAAATVAVVAAWWLSIPPSNDRDWQPDVARPATASFDGSRVTVTNVRDFVWRSDTDFDQRWDTRTYDLDQVTGVDLFISYWGPTLYAHTIASWAFADGRHLAISIEVRKEKGESYSALLGFFRQYELYYVVADERDVIGVRANVRGEQLFLYQMRASPEVARDLLRGYLQRANELAVQPAWYNALTHNCTTLIRDQIDQVVTAGVAWDWRILANGYLDQLAYERRPMQHAACRSPSCGRAATSRRRPGRLVTLPTSRRRSAATCRPARSPRPSRGAARPIPAARNRR